MGNLRYKIYSLNRDKLHLHTRIGHRYVMYIKKDKKYGYAI